MRFGHRKCSACGERSHRDEWWRDSHPTESSTGLEGISGTSTANVDQYGWTRSTHSSRSVLITCPKCGHQVTARDRRSQGFW
jgi:predicted RNA-binding Zn-ribbon protein involved in translation (DUF1610 family)